MKSSTSPRRISICSSSTESGPESQRARTSAAEVRRGAESLIVDLPLGVGDLPAGPVDEDGAAAVDSADVAEADREDEVALGAVALVPEDLPLGVGRRADAGAPLVVRRDRRGVARVDPAGGAVLVGERAGERIAPARRARSPVGAHRSPSR